MEYFKSKDGPGEGAQDSIRKDKKKPKAIGTFAIAPKQPEASAETADDIWQKLRLTKRRGGKSEAPVPLTADNSAEIPAPRTGEVSEAEAPLETLSLEERQYVAREIVSEADKLSLTVDVAEPATAESIEHKAESPPEAVITFRDKIVKDGLDAEQAFAETLRDLGVDASPVDTENDRAIYESAEPRPAGPTEIETPIPDLFEMPIDSAADRTEPPVKQSNIGSDAEALPANGIIADSEPPRHHPPLWPALRTPAQPIVPEPPRIAKEYVPYPSGADVLGAALIGGLIGYLIGRRRGRIKTERKLLPIRKKLEKQVKDLQEDIQYKEVYIRKISRQRRQDRQKLYDMERDRPDTKSEPNRQIAMEANQLHGKKVAPESIGRVLMVAEDQPAAAKKVEKPDPQQLTDKRVDTMGRAELLALSGKVNVDNTNLRHIYETHLIGEQGLRRLISEHMRGGDVQRVLREELSEHERDFERDPILRDRAKASGGASSDETLSQLLQKADVLTDREAKEELAVLKARQAHQETRHVYQQKRRHIMDVSMIVAIVVLFMLVVTLLITTR